MNFNVLTLFPEVFEPYLSTSILGTAHQKGLIDVNLIQIRDYATDKHRTVDDTPYGGGPGMVMKVEPIAKALDEIKKLDIKKLRTVVLSARGERFTQQKAEEYAKLDELVLICGRYEGIDQRVADYLADEEISIGPYVLAGGELAALVVMEAAARLIPGVLGNPESLEEESYVAHPLGKGGKGGLLVDNKTPSSSPLPGGETTEYPQFTRPEDYNGWKVPEVLLSGNHEEIRKWRKKQRK